MKPLVLVGMSGGVDSSTVAALLKKDYTVIGVTLILSEYSSSAVADAKAVCDQLGIEHMTKDFTKEFDTYVIDNFIHEYKNARTPNPCVECNFNIKFGAMFKLLDQYGIDFLATGHYANIGKKGEKFTLNIAGNIAKDQSYALYRLTQDTLKRTLFPLSAYAKSDTRQVAKELGLTIASKPDSQDICFIPNGDYRSFLKMHGISAPSGEFILNGKSIGKHTGITNYTIGQRRGLGIPYGERIYVVGFDVENNHVILGMEEALYKKTLEAINVNFISGDFPNGTFKCSAKIRYNGSPAPCQAEFADGKLLVEFDAPQRSISPGQSVVLYDDLTVLGGGIIL